MTTFIDLFCGAGFGAHGAVTAGAKPVLAVDSWSLAAQTYQDNFPDCIVENDFIENLDSSRLRLLKAALEKKHTELPTVLLTSPECIAHSIARGAKPGCEQSRKLANYILPWADVFQPDWIIVENVKRMEKWAGHEQFINDLENLGFKVNPLFLNAADFGTPQKRKRLFLICARNGEVIAQEDLESLRTSGDVSARSILEKTPDRYRSGPLYATGRARATLDRAERAFKELGENVDFLIAYYGSDYAGGWQRLEAPLRTVTTLDRFGLVTWRNGEACLRMLQPSELKRAMGAGEHRLNFGTRRDKIKLCGNGVCAPVMKVIFEKIQSLSITSQKEP